VSWLTAPHERQLTVSEEWATLAVTGAPQREHGTGRPIACEACDHRHLAASCDQNVRKRSHDSSIHVSLSSHHAWPDEMTARLSSEASSFDMICPLHTLPVRTRISLICRPTARSAFMIG
jgi:hypothetical protein